MRKVWNFFMTKVYTRIIILIKLVSVDIEQGQSILKRPSGIETSDQDGLWTASERR